MRFNEMESESERKEKEKRVTELETLIVESKSTMDQMKAVDGPAMQKKRAEDHRLLLMEKQYYANGHDFRTWPDMRKRLVEIAEQGSKETAERERLAAEKKVESEKRAAEQDAKLREEFELERDEFLAWKRAKAARTF